MARITDPYGKPPGTRRGNIALWGMVSLVLIVLLIGYNMIILGEPISTEKLVALIAPITGLVAAVSANYAGHREAGGGTIVELDENKKVPTITNSGVLPDGAVEQAEQAPSDVWDHS